MARLYKRTVSLTVGTEIIYSSTDESGNLTGLDIDFEVERSLEKSPNKCMVHIYNQSKESRQLLQKFPLVPVKLEVGYGAEAEVLIFEGDLTECTVRRDAADIVTEISSGDGEEGLRKARISKSYGKNTDLKAVAKDLTDSLRQYGIGQGNVFDKLAGRVIDKVGKAFTEGIAKYGNTARELEAVLKSSGYTMSVQRKKLQVLGPKETIGTTAVVLRSDSGLVSAPDKSSDKIVRVTSLIMPGLEPGYRIELVSEEASGTYRIESVRYEGSTFGNEFYAQLECKEI